MCGVWVFQSFIDKYMKNPTGIKLCILHNLWCLCECVHSIYQTCCFRSFTPDLLFQIIHARPVVSDHSHQTCCFRSIIPDLLFQIIHPRPVVSDHSRQTCCFRSVIPDLLFQISHTRPVVSDHSSQTCCFRSFIPVEPSCWRASCPTVVTSQYWKTVATLSTLTDPWPLAMPSFVSVVMHLLAGSDWHDIADGSRCCDFITSPSQSNRFLTLLLLSSVFKNKCDVISLCV